MAKGKATNTRPKGQATINAFFGGSKSKKEPEPDADEVATDDQAEPESQAEETETEIEIETAPVSEEEDEDVAEPEEVKKPTRASAPDAFDLPPINEIPAIFDDLVSRIPQIKEVVEHVKGRNLRVATMCSGTESPLLALELIQKSIEEQHGLKLGIEHVFSCEIEPFKQAYIERNFQPPILFRDVCELGDAEAHTAYGSLVPVPGDVDMLVAGTSCVDYSNLNTQKQDIDANGESGRTFRGMMSWVTNHRPPIVILENVCSAPWPRVQQYFEKEGYSATFTRVDTKTYYIPHTRTRVYLVAVDARKSSIPDRWKDYVTNKLKRPASSTLDAFLLPSDDPRIHVARQKLVQESYGATDKKTGRTDWSRCESRHQRARLEEELGTKRPLTSWDEGGFCKLPDFAWNDWGVGQVERVWDLMDISLMRSAAKGVDPCYKTTVWNLSQNVDRTIGSNKVGICPCLTPSMIPYITNRGGPMVGLEALSMQGLPVDKLLLTRETEDQLADLAGNAMSSTVVGACILAALVCGKKLLKAGDDHETYESKGRLVEGVERGDDAMEVDDVAAHSSEQAKILGEDKLVQKSLDLSATKDVSLAQLLSHASRSVRLCTCEGRTGMTNRELFRCKDCSSTFCKKCGGRPEHNVEPCNDVRTPPSDFGKEIKSALPMAIFLSGIDEVLFETLETTQGGETVKPALWKQWRDAVDRSKEHEFHFVELKRQEIWSAIYQSRTGVLELILHPQKPEWRLFAIPLADEPANAEIRKILLHPIARLVCKDNILSGQWEIAIPTPTSFSLTIEGTGDLVPSWEARLGLIGPAFKDKKVYSALKVTVPKDQAELFDRDISGKYVLLDKCGTANGALHKKEETAADDGLPPLFLLFDPHRTNDAKDCFVFSESIRRLEYGENRPIVCKLSTSYRQSDKQGEQKVECHLPWKWVKNPSITLKAARVQNAQYSIPNGALDLALTDDACRGAYALLTCALPLGDKAGSEWPRGEWREIDKIHERSVFRSLAWLLERIRDVGDHFRDWQHISTPDSLDCRCERCAPSAPALRWIHSGKKLIAVEDSIQAGEYERRLKRRPNPFVTQLRLDDSGLASVRIGINIPSLLHRALSRLPTKGRDGKAELLWRLDTNFSPSVHIQMSKFSILSNKNDKEHAQPPNFRIPLRKEQLRSLEWMILQEAKDADPFIEEEIAEAVLDPMGWRAEGRAQRPVRVLGGVLADQVGYGKTAITLGLIDCTSKTVNKEFSKKGRIPGKITSKATVVVVPPHLVKQWQSEVQKFMKKNQVKVVALATVTDLNKVSIESIQEADIVVVASSITKSSTYLENLTLLAGVAEFPNKDGRHFNTHLEKTLQALGEQVDRLQDKGASSVLAEIKAGQERVAAEEAATAAAIASKRLKGKSYRDAVEKAQKEASKKPKADADEEVSEDEEKPKSRTNSKPKAKKFNGASKAKVTDGLKSAAIRTPSGLVPEVVITTRPPAQFSPSNRARSSTPAVESPDSDEEVVKRPRRATARPIVIESDDESDVPPPPKRPAKKGGKVKAKNAKPAKGKKKAKGSDEESDYKAGSTDGSDEEMESLSEYDEESDAPKPTANKKKASGKKPATAPPTSASEAETDAGDMDVDDDEVSPKAKGKASAKKRKAEEEDERPAKKVKKRANNDPWKLASRAVQSDWNEMLAPPLEMFHFARVVVDEYTYLDGKVHALVTNWASDRRWVLSGTPPIHDFAAVKTIAAFLHLHLGVDDDGEGQSTEVKKRRREQTTAERFHSFREVHSLEWHAHRHTVGQRFLNQFVRQNIAEIDEIPWSEKLEEVTLPSAERAIYLELEHHLRALDMTIKRGKKTESDRERRLALSLGDSKTAEEALLKRCSHFELDTSKSNDNATKACDVIVKERTKQLNECKASLLKALKEGSGREKALPHVSQESMFNEYIRICRTEGVDDDEATQVVVELLDEAGLGNPKQPKGKIQDQQLSEKVKEKVWEHREKTHEIRRITKELTGRIRSLRYFTVVRDIQKQKDRRKPVHCPVCDNKAVPLSDVAVLSSCGHEGCMECMRKCAEKEECVYAASGKCKSAARVLNIVKADTLGVDDEKRDNKSKHFGQKLEKIINLIKNELPKDDRVLLFVQFPDLMKKVTEALNHNKIKFLQIQGTAKQKSNNLESFQNGSEERVLLLNVMDESASGANLTSANHAIFMSPLLAPSNEIYTACETQAIGRLVRYGQDKHVYVWRFLTKNTIDQEIYAQRQKALVHA
ncbi:DNA repair protein rad8 [Coprinopsis marcescibilis]|uniref:DNA repair protein rad8 n=1 Tax=Coprinopsis marcescibilis TaxID=230819 RepID=A0A5C3LA23_COPMA|nr:DNA repair protein rad8 [Coprinopsis marcescibilis]